MPIPKLPLKLLGGLEAYHLWWWRRTLRRRSVLTDWNRRHNAIFVHIPKTAGTSVLAALGADPVFDTHAPNRVYAAVYPEFHAGAFKFAFVRNPWDRFASAFHFLKSGTQWPMQQAWAKRHIGNRDFERFTLELRNPVRRAAVLSERFFWPQHFWLAGAAGTIDLDALLRFEDVENATASLCRRFGLEPPSRVPHLRRGTNPSFRDQYSPEMIEIVERIYRDDIALLNYTWL